MRRIAFSIAVFRKKLSVQSTPTSTKSRWKFYTEVGHRSFHTVWTRNGLRRGSAKPRRTASYGTAALPPYPAGLKRKHALGPQLLFRGCPPCWNCASFVAQVVTRPGPIGEHFIARRLAGRHTVHFMSDFGKRFIDREPGAI